MGEEVELRGMKELEENLVRLGKVAGSKVMRQALFVATKPILDQAKANIRAWPRGSGALELAMNRVYDTRQQESGGSRFVMQIAPRIRKSVAVSLHNLFYKRGRRGIFYGHLLEYGHRIGHRRTGRLSRGTYQGSVSYFSRFFGKSITRTGRAAAGTVKPGHVGGGSVRPQRFLKPALDSAGLRAVFVFRQQIAKRIKRALKKLDAAAENA
jgi:hypothetical protein